MYVCFYASRFVLCVRREYTHYTENSLATAKANSKAYWMCVVCICGEYEPKYKKNQSNEKENSEEKARCHCFERIQQQQQHQKQHGSSQTRQKEKKKNRSNSDEGERRKADCQAWTIWDEEELLSVTAYYINAWREHRKSRCASHFFFFIVVDVAFFFLELMNFFPASKRTTHEQMKTKFLNWFG